MDGLDAHRLRVALKALRPRLVGDLGVGAHPCRQHSGTRAGRTLFGMHQLEEMPQVRGVALAVWHREHAGQYAEVQHLAVEDTREPPAWPACRGLM